MRVALLAHDRFPDHAKTAVGVLRYADAEVVAVLDREHAGTRIREHLAGVQDAPVVGSMADVPAPVDALVIGVAPIGGGFEESWRPDVRLALERGCDVYAGLHYFLADDEEFAALAADHGADLWDLRRPPPDLDVSEGVAGDVDATVVLTVGTDCSVGKMTTTVELRDAARERGLDAGFVPTGQTGVLVAGEGVVVDRVPADFAAGVVEEGVLDAADRDVVFVEGQGSLVHPAYSGVTLSILHGAMPDATVLCHAVDRETVRGYGHPLPDPGTYVDLYESVAAPVREAPVVAGALNTAALDDGAAAREAVAAFGDAVDAPATDPVRFGAGPLLEALP